MRSRRDAVRVIDANVGSVNNGAGQRRCGNSGNETAESGFAASKTWARAHAGFCWRASFNDTGWEVFQEAPSGLSFQRRSTVSLISDTLGEVGSDATTPELFEPPGFRPFTLNGVGSQQNMMVLNQPIQARHWSTRRRPMGRTTFPRASNSIGYFLPGSRRCLRQAMAAAGEGT